MISVCLSTFNRSKLLVEMLDSLSYVASELPGLVTECVVTLNSCTDDTEERLKSFQVPLRNNGVQLRWVINDEKLHYLPSYTRSVAAATNDFIWLFSDDDLFSQGCLAPVRAALRQHGGFIDLICVNWQSYEYNMSKSVGAPALKRGGLYVSLEECLKNVDLMACLS